MKPLIWHNVNLNNPGEQWHQLMKAWANENLEKEEANKKKDQDQKEKPDNLGRSVSFLKAKP
jgi:hypothetical protein